MRAFGHLTTHPLRGEGGGGEGVDRFLHRSWVLIVQHAAILPFVLLL